MGSSTPNYGPRVVELGQPVPKGGGRYKVGSAYTVNGKTYTPQETNRYEITGTASWYGEDFHGRRTANGEIYDMEALTAAHTTLPLPCYARVTNPANGRSLVVRVNDRGPYVDDRVIDLSWAVASLLQIANAGTGRVNVQYLGPAPLDGNDKYERRMLASQPWAGPRVAYAASPAKALRAMNAGGWEVSSVETENAGGAFQLASSSPPVYGSRASMPSSSFAYTPPEAASSAPDYASPKKITARLASAMPPAQHPKQPPARKVTPPVRAVTQAPPVRAAARVAVAVARPASAKSRATTASAASTATPAAPQAVATGAPAKPKPATPQAVSTAAPAKPKPVTPQVVVAAAPPQPQFGTQSTAKTALLLTPAKAALARTTALQPPARPVALPVAQPKPPALAASKSAQSYYIEAGIFAERATADRLAAILTEIAPTAVELTTKGTRIVHRLRLGPFTEDAAANNLIARIRGAGLRDARLLTTSGI